MGWSRKPKVVPVTWENTGYGGRHLRTITLEAAALLDIKGSVCMC
jgi:hypothetical protein